MRKEMDAKEAKEQEATAIDYADESDEDDGM